MDAPKLEKLLSKARKEGFDIWHKDPELAHFLAACHEQNVKTVLELGTGRGHFARFMMEKLGWSVTSVDVNKPEWRSMEFIHGSTYDAAKRLADRRFDMVFIDADHDGDNPLYDHLLYDGMAVKVVGFHDTNLGRGCCQAAARYWHFISRDKKGNLKPGYYEHEDVSEPVGTGWYIVSEID